MSLTRESYFSLGTTFYRDKIVQVMTDSLNLHRSIEEYCRIGEYHT